MGASLRTGLPAADEKTITSLSGALAIKPNVHFDNVGGSVTNNANETILAQVQIPANSTIAFMILHSIISFSGLSVNGGSTFRMYLGPNGTTADTLIITGSGVPPFSVAPMDAVAIYTTNYDASVLNYVTITGDNINAVISTTSTCNYLQVIGL